MNIFKIYRFRKFSAFPNALQKHSIALQRLSHVINISSQWPFHICHGQPIDIYIDCTLGGGFIGFKVSSTVIIESFSNAFKRLLKTNFNGLGNNRGLQFLIYGKLSNCPSYIFHAKFKSFLKI